MNRTLILTCTFLAASAVAGCIGGTTSNGPSSSASQSWLGNVIGHAMDKASVELANHNIDVSGDNTPKAEITPKGDLLIGGKAVSLTPAQRKQVLAYRQQVVAIARQGIAIGKQGATLGVNAASEAIAGALSGEPEQQIRERVEARAHGLRQAAAKICDSLPDMMAAQQKLARDVPAFRPYADLTPARIAECRRDALQDHDDNDRAQVQESTRDRIRQGIRSGAQAAAQGAGLASRGTPDASTPPPAESSSRH